MEPTDDEMVFAGERHAMRRFVLGWIAASLVLLAATAMLSTMPEWRGGHDGMQFAQSEAGDRTPALKLAAAATRGDGLVATMCGLAGERSAAHRSGANTMHAQLFGEARPGGA